VAFLFKEYEV
jgi:hypothetical protein